MRDNNDIGKHTHGVVHRVSMVLYIYIYFFFICVMQVYNLLRKGAVSKCVRSGTCGKKASIDDTPSRPVSG